MKIDFRKKVLDNAPFGYAYHKIVLNKNKEPINYIFLEVNKEFEKITGLNRESIINKKVTKVFPGIRDDFDWIDYYGNLVLKNKEKEFEQYSKTLNKYYQVKAYSPKDLHFVTIFKDIDKEIKIAKSSHQLLESTAGPIDYKSITDKLLNLSGAKYVAFNRFEENGKDFRTMALSGVNEKIKKGIKLLGFDPVGKEWDHDPSRADMIAGKATTYFEKLSNLTSKVIPKKIINTIEKIFGLGQTAIVKITQHGEMIGDFTIMMPKGKTLKNEKLIETYAQQVGLFIDKKQAEKKLRESEERYRIVTEKNKDGIFILQDNKIVFANNIICRIIGLSKEELKLINFWKLLHPDDRHRIKEIAKNRAQGEETQSVYEGRCITKDGDILHLEFSVSPIEYNGKYAVLGTIRDISKQKQLQKELRKSEKKYRTLVESSHDAIIILQKGKFKYVNKAFSGMLNLNSENIIGKQYNDIFNKEAVEKIHSIKNDGKASHFETTLNRDGNQINLESNTTIIEYDQEPAIFATIRDITKQKRIMEKLKQKADQTNGLDNLIPICAGCNKIQDRDKEDEPWISPAEYITERLPEVEFTHGMCPECIKEWYPNLDFGNDEE